MTAPTRGRDRSPDHPSPCTTRLRLGPRVRPPVRPAQRAGQRRGDHAVRVPRAVRDHPARGRGRRLRRRRSPERRRRTSSSSSASPARRRRPSPTPSTGRVRPREIASIVGLVGLIWTGSGFALSIADVVRRRVARAAPRHAGTTRSVSAGSPASACIDRGERVRDDVHRAAPDRGRAARVPRRRDDQHRCCGCGRRGCCPTAAHRGGRCCPPRSRAASRSRC